MSFLSLEAQLPRSIYKLTYIAAKNHEQNIRTYECYKPEASFVLARKKDGLGSGLVKEMLPAGYITHNR